MERKLWWKLFPKEQPNSYPGALILLMLLGNRIIGGRHKQGRTKHELSVSKVDIAPLACSTSANRIKKCSIKNCSCQRPIACSHCLCFTNNPLSGRSPDKEGHHPPPPGNKEEGVESLRCEERTPRNCLPQRCLHKRETLRSTMIFGIPIARFQPGKVLLVGVRLRSQTVIIWQSCPP